MENKNIFEQFNTYAKTLKEGLTLETMEFKSLKEFRGQTLKVDGFFFTNSGKYGKQVVLVANNCKINMPKRAVETFEEIAKNDKLLNAVLEGHMEITDIREIETRQGTSTSYSFKTC